MKDDDRILLMMGWCLLMMGIMLLICKVQYRTDQINKKLDQIIDSENYVSIYVSRSSMITEAPDIMHEPSDDEIVMSVNIATPSQAIEEPLKAIKEPEVYYVGTYQLTAYIATGNPCADGTYPVVGYTAACNDRRLWHKWIHIDGYGDYYIHDTGGMASNVIDIFVGSYSEAIQFGRRSADVYIKESE